MQRSLGYTLVLVVVLGCGAIQVLARGGHGGGHGGHHGGHHSGHRGHQGHHRHVNNHHASHFAHHHSHWANHNRPFSRGWYGRHRGAWGGGWGWGNPWNIATWGTTAAWLGLGAAAPAWGGYGPTNTTIYDTDNDDLNAPDSQLAGGQNLSPEALAKESAAARTLAAKGATEPANDDKFMPLGIFTLAPENQTEASAMLQLAVSKQGVLRGSYYDLLSDVNHPIRGSVDKQSQRVAWTFGPQGKVTFQTALPVLTEPSGPVAVHYENGQTRQWVLARYEKEPSDNDPQGDESGDETKTGAASK
jgi:hypothetical protein